MSVRKLLLAAVALSLLALAIPWLRARGPQVEPNEAWIRESFRIVDARTESAASDVVRVLVQRVRALGFATAKLDLVGLERLDVRLPSTTTERDRQLLRRVVARVGRAELAVEATDAVCAARGSTLDAERLRVETWSVEHPGLALVEFDALPSSSGGPLRGLVWRAPWLPGSALHGRRDVEATEAAAPSHQSAALVPLENASRGALPIAWVIEARDARGGMGLELEVGAAALALVRGLLYERAGKDLVLVVDDEVCARQRIENGQKPILFFSGAALAHAESRRELLAVLVAGPLGVRLEPRSP